MLLSVNALKLLWERVYTMILMNIYIFARGNKFVFLVFQLNQKTYRSERQIGRLFQLKTFWLDKVYRLVLNKNRYYFNTP